MVSWNPEDVARGYCGNCHAFTRELAGLAELMDRMGLVGAAMLAEDGPVATVHNALVKMAEDVQEAAVQAARTVTAVTLAAGLAEGDEMRWIPGDPEM